MRVTAWEEERLLVFTAAELARRRRARGLRLNAPEAVAVICDAMLEAARDGATLDDVAAAGRGAVAPDDVLAGVDALVDEVRLEVLMDDGTRLVVLVDPLGGGASSRTDAPGAIVPQPDAWVEADAASPHADRERRRVDVRNGSRRAVRVSSHMPFDRVNPRLEFDRAVAVGFRLDLPAGSSERWAAGEEKTVDLVRFAGAGDTDRPAE